VSGITQSLLGHDNSKGVKLNSKLQPCYRFQLPPRLMWSVSSLHVECKVVDVTTDRRSLWTREFCWQN